MDMNMDKMGMGMGMSDEGADDTALDTGNESDIAELDAACQKMQAIVARMKGGPGSRPSAVPPIGMGMAGPMPAIRTK